METWLMDKKNGNLVEWDTFRLWLVLTCNGQKRCDKSTAQRFWTAIVRAMGQQKRSKRTASNSIDRFWNQICPIFPSWGLCIDFFRFFWGSSYHEMIVSQEPKMVWGSKPYVNVTQHGWQKMAIVFPVWPNASQNKSLQNAFPFFKC